jgi:hypothetical protein
MAASGEKGVCIICGKQGKGTGAAPDLPIKLARKLRALLRLHAKRTMVCPEHAVEAGEKRKRYEKSLLTYRLGALLFFIIMAAGSFAFGRGDLGLFLPALIGAGMVALLPYAYYFPSFKNQARTRALIN